VTKARLSATVESELLLAGRAAVAEGRAKNLSTWVSTALRRQADHDWRAKALDEFFDAYEADHGVITAAEMQAATEEARARAVAIHPEGVATTGDGRRRRRGVA